MSALHAADEATIRREMEAMGVECIEPASEREQATAALMEAFATFVLEEQPRQSLAMLQENHDGSVGELQGGNEHAIYRVEITDDEESVVSRLLRAHGHGLTVERIRRHMLRRGIERLDNFMLVLAFGPTSGQIRHIDAMVPNRQLCCYMSRDCPSTVVYAPDGPAVDSGAALVALWEEEELEVPAALRTRLVAEGGRQLEGRFKFWRTIDDALRCFGKLYQPVARRLALTCAPGTLLSAGRQRRPRRAAHQLPAYVRVRRRRARGRRRRALHRRRRRGPVQRGPLPPGLVLRFVWSLMRPRKFSARSAWYRS